MRILTTAERVREVSYDIAEYFIWLASTLCLKALEIAVKIRNWAKKFFEKPTEVPYHAKTAMTFKAIEDVPHKTESSTKNIFK